MSGEEMREMIEYYRGQGAPQDQQMLIALMREMQAAEDGMLSLAVLEMAAQAYGIRISMLQALIRRVPDLKCDNVRHRLEICGTCRAGAGLRDFIERTYSVTSGSVHETLGFAYRVTPCMKNCKNAPSVRWDGKLYGQADETLIRTLLERRTEDLPKR